MADTKKIPVSFRIPKTLHDMLVVEAAAAGESAGKTAEAIVTAHLHDAKQIDGLHRELGGLRDQLAATNRNVLRAVELLLVNAGRPVDPDVARKTVADHFES